MKGMARKVPTSETVFANVYHSIVPYPSLCSSLKAAGLSGAARQGEHPTRDFR